MNNPLQEERDKDQQIEALTAENARLRHLWVEVTKLQAERNRLIRELAETVKRLKEAVTEDKIEAWEDEL